jgi:hypothetical protein
MIVMFDIATGEAAKSGCAPSEAIGIARHIKESCPHLSLQGIMTIGSIVRSRAKGEENQDFLLLNETAKTVERELGIELELSIGMSNDFEEAIKLGARNVRSVVSQRDCLFVIILHSAVCGHGIYLTHFLPASFITQGNKSIPEGWWLGLISR